MGRLSESARSFKIWVIAILLGLVLVFVVQNHRVQDIRFLLWQVRLSLSLALFLMAGVGLVVGFLWGAHKARAKD